LRTCQMIILLRSNIRSNLIPVVKQQIITTLPFILLIRV
ncbi:sulfatase YdeN, partial [Escherichia coli]